MNVRQNKPSEFQRDFFKIYHKIKPPHRLKTKIVQAQNVTVVGKDEEVEKALFAWFKFARNNNAPVDGPILMQKANAIAQAAGHDDFKVTDG